MNKSKVYLRELYGKEEIQRKKKKRRLMGENERN